MTTTRAQTALYTLAALVAFAANSLLCRRALGHAAIDAASFSTIRLASGAVVLLLLARASGHGSKGARGSWRSALILFLYAVPFSFAYIRLTAGTGALILFATVQGTMLSAALFAGARLSVVQWSGLILAFGGLVYLVVPGLAAPSPGGCALMTLAGIAWGLYSLRGRSASDPLAETAGNFARAVPFAVLVSLLATSRVRLSHEGALLAVLSGVLASGCGYVIWYAALRGLSAAQAASVQLAVPVLAASGGVVFLSEPVTARMILSSILILGGIALALTRTAPRRRPRPPGVDLRA